jgi:hypothetical protein
MRFDRHRKPGSIQPPAMPPKARQNSRNLAEAEGKNPTCYICFEKAKNCNLNQTLNSSTNWLLI